jgi:hypothetical protein
MLDLEINDGVSLLPSSPKTDIFEGESTFGYYAII